MKIFTKTIAADELALALEIAGNEGVPLPEALVIAARELAELQAYARDWDAQAWAALSQPVSAA